VSFGEAGVALGFSAPKQRPQQENKANIKKSCRKNFIRKRAYLYYSVRLPAAVESFHRDKQKGTNSVVPGVSGSSREQFGSATGRSSRTRHPAMAYMTAMGTPSFRRLMVIVVLGFLTLFPVTGVFMAETTLHPRRNAFSAGDEWVTSEMAL
jgi:hypothetical protein